jgi:hypothetical protein
MEWMEILYSFVLLRRPACVLPCAVTMPPRFALEPAHHALSMPGMATHRAIAAVGKSLVGLLAEKCPKTEFVGAAFTLFQSSDFAATKRPLLGISLCLCRVSINANQRNPTLQTPLDGRRQRPPLPLDLYFVLTAWAKTSARQHDLLGWAMCVLDENAVLSAATLNRFAGGTGVVFGPAESVEIAPTNLDFEQMSTVCDLLQIHQHPSIVYIARPVLIQSSGN